MITLYSLYLLTIFLIYKLGYELLESIRNTFSLNIKNNRVSTNLILGFLFLNFLALILNFFTALNDYLSLTILFLLWLILILRLNRRDINIGSSAGDDAVPTSANKQKFVGVFQLDSSISTGTHVMTLTDVPLSTPGDCEFYIENALTNTIPAAWTLKVTPKTDVGSTS